MKCYQCRTHFYPRRTLKTLFDEPLQLRCDRCDRRYPRLIQYTTIPIDGFILHHYALFHTKIQIQEEAFLDETLKLILRFLERGYPNDLILFADELKNELFYYLDQLNLCDIFIICLFPCQLMI